MTQVNLRDGLVAAHSHQTRYWDAQRDRFQDVSGWSQAAQMEGGVTVGQVAPAEFESTHFPGSSFNMGRIQMRDPIGSPINQDITMAVLFKIDDNFEGDRAGIFSHGSTNSGSFGYQTQSSTDVQFAVYDAVTTSHRFEYELGKGTWGFFVQRFNSEDGTTDCYVDGEQVGEYDYSDATELGDGSDFDYAASSPMGGGETELYGNIAYSAIWARGLTEAEVSVLSKLSGLQRGML